jgi:hypothetical protein
MSTEEWSGEERRSASREEFVKAVVCAIREEAVLGGITEEEHREQHAFIREWIEEVKIKRDRREKIKTQVLGWGLVTFLGSIGTASYHSFLYLKEHLK